KETLNNLMKPENKDKLQDILQYHVFVGILRPEMLQDGQTYNQVNGGNITISKKDGKIVVNNTANVIATIPASNGIIHVMDAVLLPPSK
ncbi:MAG: fasciclin domain-containing protein, partial [Flavisolibacter sp.]|nr:fasciclin domain-containing protein [Flavisolibacter sp.]